MASTKRTKKTPFTSKGYNFLFVLAVMLGMIAGVLSVRVFYKDDTPANVISLGSMEYKIVGNKAVKSTMPATTALRAALGNEATNSGCSQSNTGYYGNVLAYTKDKSQVLLGYGCGSANAHMFATYKNKSWQFISPTNQFDNFNIPACNYVKQYALSKEVAPVCHAGAGKYSIR